MLSSPVTRPGYAVSNSLDHGNVPADGRVNGAQASPLSARLKVPAQTPSSGSASVPNRASIARPSHPEYTDESGLPASQMSDIAKWLNEPSATPTPCTIANSSAAQRSAR